MTIQKAEAFQIYGTFYSLADEKLGSTHIFKKEKGKTFALTVET